MNRNNAIFISKEPFQELKKIGGFQEYEHLRVTDEQSKLDLDLKTKRTMLIVMGAAADDIDGITLKVGEMNLISIAGLD